MSLTLEVGCVELFQANKGISHAGDIEEHSICILAAGGVSITIHRHCGVCVTSNGDGNTAISESGNM